MAGVVDFVFCIDGSGSMGECIAALQDNIGMFIDEVTGVQSVTVHDWRGKVVVYRDQAVDGERWLEDNPFVHNDAAALRAQLSRVEAQGGGDEPESALDVLHLLSTMDQTDRNAQEVDPNKWRYRSDAARVVILFTDASFKTPMTYPGGAGGTLVDARNAIMNNKIQLIMYAPDDDGWADMSAVDKCEWTPISEPYVDSLKDMVGNSESFQKAMRALAASVSRSMPTEEL